MVGWQGGGHSHCIWARPGSVPSFWGMATTQENPTREPQRKSQQQPQQDSNEASKHRLPEHPPTPDQLKPGTLPEGNGAVPGPAAFPPHN